MLNGNLIGLDYVLWAYGWMPSVIVLLVVNGVLLLAHGFVYMDQLDRATWANQ